MRKIYVLAISLIGILTFAQEEKQDSIDYNPIEIKEVLVQAQRKKMFADKSVYTFDKDALEKARYAKDLLNTLPELNIDPVSNTIQSIKGGTTLILINGIEATDNQIRSVKPQDVVRVEYFDIPPSRWANRADQVVNLITRNPENGYVFGVEGVTSPLTGFVDGSAYANFTKGRNNFGVEYLLNLRDYDNRENVNTYEYLLDNNHYKTTEHRFDHFGYTSQNAVLRYTNTDSDKYTFQTKLDLEIFNSFTDVNGESIFLMNQIPEDHTTYKHGNSSYTKPTLDIYYSRKFGKKDELSLNVVGSNFKTNTYELSKEWLTSNGNSVFDNEMKLKAEQTSIVGEVAHTHDFKSGKLSSGYRISTNDIKNDLENLEGVPDYKVNYLQQYMYTEFSGKTKKLMYRLGMGLTNIHNQSADDTQNTWTITPKIVLGYELTKNQSLRFTSSYTPTSPWSDALSSNVVQMVPNIVRKGNPELNIQKSFGNNLIYSFNSKYFDINTNLFYWYRKDAINQFYVLDGNRYALTYENAQNSQQYGVQVSGSVKPFGTDIFTLKVVLAPASESVKLKNGETVKNNYIGNNFVISSVYKNLSFMYLFNVPTYSLRGPFLNTNENKSHLVLSYKWNNWSFKTGAYWLGMPSEYKTKSLNESLVNFTSHTQIWNNKNMFILGFSYDFATGKKTNINRKLENQTAGAASF
ncbi:outer membrane beta-barrel protein [Empedobacter brevis]|uniref:TonB-dependent receptor plug domain-containing protein n=1 Tax=Empedobacter brevis TaxID=247 RepID=UPI0028CFED02|nr:outer membrane beta-barrel protein [Empedobacter brevis]